MCWVRCMLRGVRVVCVVIRMMCVIVCDVRCVCHVVRYLFGVLCGV